MIKLTMVYLNNLTKLGSRLGVSPVIYLKLTKLLAQVVGVRSVLGLEYSSRDGIEPT